MKRFLTRVEGRCRLAAIIFAALLAACSARPAATTQAGVIVAVPSGETARALTAAAEAYAKVDDGAVVTVAALDGGQYNDRTAAALLAGLDTYDLVLLEAHTLPRWVQYGALRPLEQPRDPAAYRPWMDGLVVDGIPYALPAQADPLVLWYRADLLKAAGVTPPFDTWDDLVRAARAAGGLALAGGDMDAGTEFIAALSAADAPAFDALTRQGEVTPGAARVLEGFSGLFGAEGIAPRGAENFGRGEALDALLDGRSAMAFAPLSAGARLLDCPGAGAVCQGEKALLSAANLPGGQCAALGSLSVWAVPLHAAHPGPAGRFAAWLVSEEGGQAWAAGGGLPPNRQALEKVPSAASPAARVLAGAECYWTAFAGLPTSDIALQALNAAVHRAVTGELSASAALNEAGTELRRALRQGGMLE